MGWLKWLVAAIAILMGGWMTFDGARAFVKGDYVTPREGPFAGQLGPWAKLVRGTGLEPRSAPVKAAFVVLGLAWLIMAVAHVMGLQWSRPGLIVLSALSIWYVPIGTALVVIELALLFLSRGRAG